MKSDVRKVRRGVIFVILAVFVILGSACVSSQGTEENQGFEITSLRAEHEDVYPVGNTKIECIVSNAKGDTIDYKWTCTGGSFSGSDSVVTWIAPNAYGDYHIMVIAEDGENGKDQSTLTLNVVARPESTSCCGR